MTAVWWILGTVGFLTLAVLLTAYICFYKVFYSSRREREEQYPIPEGDIYEPYRDVMVEYIKKADATPYREVSIRSFDGLTLRGRYYEFSKGAPIELMLHGYRGSGRRDLSGGIERCALMGHNAFIIDHRASGESEGHVITFGLFEGRDCLAWLDFILREIDPNAKVMLTGISMGAATVLGCSDLPLPENVVGILADCGYTSTRAIVKKVIRDMRLPAELLYPFTRLGARIYGGFDPDSRSPIESVKKSRLPIIFFHGDTDDFVPYDMSVENYEACASANKRMVNVPGAGHGLCFLKDPELYLAELHAFFDPLTGADR